MTFDFNRKKKLHENHMIVKKRKTKGTPSAFLFGILFKLSHRFDFIIRVAPLIYRAVSIWRITLFWN